ncbi:FKBP-type peptidyl-prolyl cis-trans isomerase [Catelliglobosispora koreensis]|uniref:FKBP-type peptidyl-prolyl cis-trans isomerase n=1 Tax=Catelliglobosispora koreensis TaxID=129052 RepID=UPI0003771C37|nr:FKBP-type peptidyl-prolyl cis-trans isomerase [Catelliglobosispora koreensis]
MSKRVFTPPPGQVLTKAEKRDAAKAARARQAAIARRKVMGKNALIILVVVGVLVGIGLFIKNLVDSTPTASPTPTSEPTAAPTATAPATPFPGVPAGANEALKTKPVVEKPTGTVSELKVTTLIEGTGPVSAAGKKIVVNYVGVSFKDGTEFDSSWKSSRTFEVTLGQGSVIKGWDQGLLNIKAGSRVQLDIPSAMAYGDNGQVPGALRFVVDVLSVS